MANMCLFVVYDRVAEESGPIFEAVNVGVAQRKYREIIKNSNVQVQEYQLLQVATFDHVTNKMIVVDPPEYIECIPQVFDVEDFRKAVSK